MPLGKLLVIITGQSLINCRKVIWIWFFFIYDNKRNVNQGFKNREWWWIYYVFCCYVYYDHMLIHHWLCTVKSTAYTRRIDMRTESSVIITVVYILSRTFPAKSAAKWRINAHQTGCWFAKASELTYNWRKSLQKVALFLFSAIVQTKHTQFEVILVNI